MIPPPLGKKKQRKSIDTKVTLIGKSGRKCAGFKGGGFFFFTFTPDFPCLCPVQLRWDNY